MDWPTHWSPRAETVLRLDADEDTVLLQVMKIPRLDRGNGYESVLWDTACSSMFLRTG